MLHYERVELGITHVKLPLGPSDMMLQIEKCLKRFAISISFNQLLMTFFLSFILS